MNESQETRSMAMFCDFENIALGVEEKDNALEFDINRVLDRLLLKGNIVVKKAYCDWSRYHKFKRSLHEASFELIDIPHIRISGKNSADIRMVVDALDLCYTKSHLDTFVIVSGDSDFSPLVSKLRENDKIVIGVGVKNSTSDLLTSNCDEFIYYDDLIRRRKQRGQQKKDTSVSRSPSVKDEKKGSPQPKEKDRTEEAFDLVAETYEALVEERGDNRKVWGSMVKQALKRQRPGFSESYYGFSNWNDLLEKAKAAGHLKLESDEKSGGYIILGTDHS